MGLLRRPSGSKNPDAAVEWVKWSTSSDVLADFGKTWVNPVPRSLVDRAGQGRPLDQRRGQGGDRDLRPLGGGIEDHEHGAAIFAAPRGDGVIISGVMSKAHVADEALKEAQAAAEEVDGIG